MKSKTISITWSTEDIVERAKERKIKLSNKKANEILDLMDRRHDCTIGWNWDVIDCHTDYVLGR